MQTQTRQTSVYVYEAPVRLWHWINAASILVLSITGFLIANPLSTQPGEASANFIMGYIRFVHFSAAYIFAVGLIGRVYWALVGNDYARQLFRLPIFSKAYWSEVLYEMRWYAFIAKEPKKYIGHNPLAHLVMVIIVTLGSVAMVGTGFALYAEQSGMDSWQDKLFGWLIPVVGQSQDVRLWHHWGMWIILLFVMVHVYAAIREDIMSRQSLISTMISGWRMFKDDRKD